MSDFTQEVTVYFTGKGITVNKTEESGTESGVFHVSQADLEKAQAMQAEIEKDLGAYTAFSKDYGMNVVIVEREEDDEDEE